MSKLLDLTQSRVAIIDDIDYPRASRHLWWFYKRVITTIDGVRTSLPRYILCETNPKVKVYCKDGDQFNCRRSNLTRKRSETDAGIPATVIHGWLTTEMRRHKQMVVDMENGIESVTSGKLRDRITHAESVLIKGDKLEMMKITKIMRKIK